MITLMTLAVTVFHIVHQKSSLPVRTENASHQTSIVMVLITVEITWMTITVKIEECEGMFRCNNGKCTTFNRCVTKRTTVVMALMRLIM
jgi:hypothetical protein